MAQQRRNIANCQIENVFSSVITIMSFHGSYIQCKCKRKRKWKCKRVHTSNANAKKERYGSAVEVFFQDSRQRLSFCRFTRVGSKRKCKLKKMKSCSLPAFKLAFAFAFASYTCESAEGGVGTNLITLLGNYIRLFKVGLPQTLHVLQIV